ncbi:hypothetical protein N7457_003392 [Penicillium paradoxum]|uniref:uncharacterized protein n=1 Tax=Penicillium paradoxum TaxID=176176 RepID=UPI0025471BF8|nr:uncharacterized protein N7457_003392 [Penicillium paradoxum]KAJ5788402.1 hypothetical protein N7457_003392 [Penicillium paradoxum]
MANYMSVPIIEEFVMRLREGGSNYLDNMGAMLSIILTYCFPATQGFGVSSKQNENNNPQFAISRLRFVAPGVWSGFVDHTVILAKNPTDTQQQVLEQLMAALDKSRPEKGRCWAILAMDMQLRFYEYHNYLDNENRLRLWAPPGVKRSSFDIEYDDNMIDWVFTHMRQHNEPPAQSAIL